MIPLEKIQFDPKSSMRVLYHKVNSEVYKWDFHYHPEIEIVYVFDGIGRRHVGNHLSFYENGDLVLIGPNLPHSGFGYGALGIHEEVVIQFSEELFKSLPELESVSNLLRNSKQGLCFSKKQHGLLKQSIINLLNQNGLERYFTLINILLTMAGSHEYFILNESGFDQKILEKNQKRTKNLIDFVTKNYMKEIGSHNAAEMCHMTKPAFCNYFKKSFGVSFTEFLNEYRISQACLMLLENENVSDVAFKCGFNSLSYFSRTFKKIKNKSPMVFSQQNI